MVSWVFLRASSTAGVTTFLWTMSLSASDAFSDEQLIGSLGAHALTVMAASATPVVRVLRMAFISSLLVIVSQRPAWMEGLLPA